MRKFFVLAILSILSGCSFASDSYRPGVQGVRDVPHVDNYVDLGNSPMRPSPY